MRKREGNKEQAILDAAVKVFAQHGYHRAKISSIAEHAKVATGSIYLYYRDKENILLTIFDRFWTTLTAELHIIVKRTDIHPTEKLDLVIDAFFKMFIANSSLATVFVNEQNHLVKDKRSNVAKQFENYLDIAEEIIREGVRKGQFNPDIDIKLFRHYIIGGIRTVLQYWAQQPNTLSLDRICNNVKYFSKNGLLIK
ncbi:MAG TPA: TetR/AcrR family transcriptional regulator [Bacteroidota bacterium]|nr:TetR/AcrR family transcriptional regulator [Bacteroidota bacterium]